MSLTGLFLKQRCYFLHVSWPKFQNSDFFSPYHSLHRKLWFTCLNSKIRYIRPGYELFSGCGRSCLSLPYLWNIFVISFMSLGLSFGIQIFSAHVLSYIVSFDLHVWTLKTDIIRPVYELFTGCGCSCLSLHYLWNNFSISFLSLSLSYRFQIFSAHIIA